MKSSEFITEKKRDWRDYVNAGIDVADAYMGTNTKTKTTKDIKKRERTEQEKRELHDKSARFLAQWINLANNLHKQGKASDANLYKALDKLISMEFNISQTSSTLEPYIAKVANLTSAEIENTKTDIKQNKALAEAVRKLIIQINDNLEDLTYSGDGRPTVIDAGFVAINVHGKERTYFTFPKGTQGIMPLKNSAYYRYELVPDSDPSQLVRGSRVKIPKLLRKLRIEGTDPIKVIDISGKGNMSMIEVVDGTL